MVVDERVGTAQRRGGRRQSPNATAGLVLGLVGTAVSLVMIAMLFADG